MLAALDFRKSIIKNVIDRLPQSSQQLRLQVELFGSLSFTGKGHSTDGAVCAGLCGMHPRTSEPHEIWAVMPNLREKPQIEIDGRQIGFDPDSDIKWEHWTMDGEALPHPNTIRFRLYDGDKIVSEQIELSVGGGFVETVDPATRQRRPPEVRTYDKPLPHPYNSAAEFVEQCANSTKSAWQVVIDNEAAKGMNEATLRSRLHDILQTFDQCIESGLSHEGILPGGLNVKRRAKALYEQMKAGKAPGWGGSDIRPSIYAMAVNEENAAGGRVVTAPTNGSSGLIPAVWRTLKESNNLSQETLENGLIVASVIGALVKTHASISGAEVGCQGEVGTSCAMAAAGAVAMLGGNAEQMEQAAEIGIEHHLGMTCDPIMGLVQVPCIERNAMGAVKALNAAFLSLASDGSHLVSLDRALEVMKQTGLDMNQKYKETATGGLALG
jgi:L-serine dehydratase